MNLTLLPLATAITLAWDATSPEIDSGYRLKWGFEIGGPYPNVVEAGPALSVIVDEPWPLGSTVYFTAYAYDFLGLESGPSNEVAWTVPIPTPTPTPEPTPEPTPTPTPEPTPTPDLDGPGLHKGWYK
jgi:hypothetical protein